MHNKFIPALIGVSIIILIGGLVMFQQEQKESAAAIEAQRTTIPVTDQGSYTLAEISVHASVSDCWSAINGGVYDLTSWVPRHPGGERAIESICGKDGSAAFNGQHAGGAPQAELLVTMKVGDLK